VNDMKQFDMESFFYLLNEDEKKLVMERMHKGSFSMGEYVFKQGDTGERLYVVEKGAVSLIKSIGADLNKTVLIAPEGSIFGEFSFIDGLTRSASALVSSVDAVLLSLDRKDFDALFEQFPAIGRKLYNNLLFTVTQRLRRSSEAHWKTIENVIKNEKFINPDVA
jgi:CRP/FNR family transcriptional regulator, cyclic AMP receptor protein